MITSHNLDKLTDREALIFYYCVVRYKCHKEIAQIMKLSISSISDCMTQIYNKLGITPRNIPKLRQVWQHSLIENKMQRELLKEKAVEG